MSLCEELYITVSYPLSTFFKDREIEKYVKPEEPEPEPQPEEIPVQGIQLIGLKSSSPYSSSDTYVFCVVLRVQYVSLHLYVRYSVLNVHLSLMYSCHLYYLFHINVAYMDASFVVFISACAVFLIIYVQC